MKYLLTHIPKKICLHDRPKKLKFLRETTESDWTVSGVFIVPDYQTSDLSVRVLILRKYDIICLFWWTAIALKNRDLNLIPF